MHGQAQLAFVTVSSDVNKSSESLQLRTMPDYSTNVCPESLGYEVEMHASTPTEGAARSTSDLCMDTAGTKESLGTKVRQLAFGLLIPFHWWQHCRRSRLNALIESDTLLFYCCGVLDAPWRL